MQIIKLYIHNYKSFYDSTVEFDKMNILVGENNSETIVERVIYLIFWSLLILL